MLKAEQEDSEDQMINPTGGKEQHVCPVIVYTRVYGVWPFDRRETAEYYFWKRQWYAKQNHATVTDQKLIDKLNAAYMRMVRAEAAVLRDAAKPTDDRTVLRLRKVSFAIDVVVVVAIIVTALVRIILQTG